MGQYLTHQEVLQMGGKYPLRNGKFVWSEKAFSEEFSVGDIVTGGASIVGKITAIGAKRFLYKVTYGDRFYERVGTIRSMTGWGRPQ